jgi:hypothetical protein
VLNRRSIYFEFVGWAFWSVGIGGGLMTIELLDVDWRMLQSSVDVEG